MKEKIREILRPWLIILLLIGLSHQVSEKIFYINFRLVDNYLDPLLLMPVILHLCLWEKRVLYKKGNEFTFTTIQLVVYFVFISIVSEYFLPKWKPGFTSDIWDVFCYGVGTLFFAIFLNKPSIHQKLITND